MRADNWPLEIIDYLDEQFWQSGQARNLIVVGLRENGGEELKTDNYRQKFQEI